MQGALRFEGEVRKQRSREKRSTSVFKSLSVVLPYGSKHQYHIPFALRAVQCVSEGVSHCDARGEERAGEFSARIHRSALNAAIVNRVNRRTTSTSSSRRYRRGIRCSSSGFAFSSLGVRIAPTFPLWRLPRFPLTPPCRHFGT